jgi:hybrid polyketide synthase/nonribosomal peptide synthetase ACE1
LIDFDEPYFRDMTAIKFNALQNMFRAAKQVLWAGENGRAAKPHVNMMVGLARTLQHEVPELSLQLLDFEDVDKEMTVAQTAHYLATSILRLILSGSAKWMENILWSNELEILIKNWKLWIPRVKTDPRPNDRLNSSRRKIISTADLELLQVEICQKEDTREWSISCNDRISKLPVPEDYVKVRVKFSLIHPIRLMAGSFFFLCLGDEIPTGRQVIAVSRSNASVIVVPVAWTTLCRFKDRGEEAQKYLWVFACGLIGRNIIEASPISNTALVHEPDEYLRTILTYQANQIGMAIRFTRLHSSAETEDSSIVVHPFASSRHTRGVLPQNVESVFDMSNSAETIASMARCAPHLFWHPTSWTFGPRPILSGDSSSTNSIRDILSGISCLLDQRTAMTEANISPNALGLKVSKHLPLWNELESLHFPNDRLVRAADFAMNDAPRITPFTIISWEQTTTIPICINPVDASKMFSHEKSYLLVGLTGELGQSLARWMVLNGARYIVLTSRNPQVHSQWLEEIRSSGVVIEITPLDVSDLLGLRKVVENIRATMPPIGGVANAAMVLSDQSFMEMSIDQFDRVIRPKVTGSQNLDDLFPSDKSLDFFILFSSLAAVVGNRGQANYNAANMYLTSLARQRRRRGVVASVMNIGMIIGLGYLSRFGTTYEEKFRKMNFMPISEHELHTMFAEAIIAGKSESEDDTDMIIGLQEATGTEDVANLPAWFKDPRFSHMVQSPSAITETPTSKKSIFSVAEQLSQAASYSEVCSKLQDALVNHLGRMLQMPTEKINANTPLTSLGIDSLIAVDLRTWLLAQLKVDVPIFKILGGPSIVQMCAEIVPKLAKELLPAIDREDALEQKSVKGLETSNAELQHAPKQEVYQEQTESPIRNQPTSPSQDSSDRSTSTGAWNIITEAESSVPSEVFVSSTISPETDSMTQNIKFIKEGKASIGQSSLLFLRNYLKDGSTSNIGIQFTLRGPLKQNRFADAINAVISKHEILRTAFHRDVGLKTQVQAVLERSSFQLQYKTMGTDAEMQREYDRLMSTEFDLNRGHTMEAILIRRSANIYNAMFCYHHVIMDGVSWRLFVNELHQAYKSHSMAPLDHHQIEFAQKEEDMLNRGELASELVHWKNEFAQLPETLPLLPISKVPCRRALTVYDTSTVSLNLDLTIGARIRQASKALAITPFQFYLSTLQVLLFLHTGTPDQCIGMVDANRSDQDFANTIGYFINTLALRFNVDGSLRFEELAVQTRKKVYLAMANSRLPFNVLLDELKIPRSTTHSPLFQVLMNYRLGALEQNKLGDCDLTDMKGTVPKTPYDMTLLVVETSKGDCLLQFDVQKYLYSDDDTCQLLKSYMHLLDILSQNPSSKINECNVFSSAMIQESLEHARGNIPLEIDPNATLLDHIDSHFRRSNANIAIKDSYNQVWQYGDLEKKVHALCSKLHATGIQRSGSIALLCEPSADAVCAMLAIWRHGATCIPLDLSNPVARLDAIINECQPAAILFHHQSQHVLSRLNTQGAPGIEISDEIQTADVHQSRVESFAKPDSHALLLYTSGTTGKPKGIALTHINLLNCILGIQKSLNLGQETVLQQSSLGFDLSIAQILISLSGGGRLIIPKREQRGDAIELSKLMLLEKVTFTFCVPSEYSILLRFGHADLKKCSEWRVAMSAGERLTSRIKEEFRGLGSSVKLFNAYGPAETTIISHLTEVSYHFDDYADGGEEFESVGRPLPNFSTYIVDEARNPVPVGFPGEVCIGGPSVSPGYSHNDVLNEQKFFPNQFSTQHEKEFKWDRLYRSGDRGRLLSDGSLLPLGRIDGDHQIKLRGMRVELGSIESSILTTARGIIRDAIVIERGQPSFLVGFVTFVEDNRPRDPENFLRTLIGELPEPEYMRPMVIVPLESIPRGANGKTDRNALRKVAIQRNPETQPTDNEPLTATESKLSELWRGLLFEDGATPLDIHKDTDFFAVGGTSLLLVELQHLIHEEFQVSIPLRDFFQASSLRRMAERTIPGVTQTELPRQINWAEETAISHDLLDIKKLPVTESSGRQLRVVLTGAFGFLGKAILQCLVDNSSVSEIHCIAIRQKNGSPGRKSPIKSDKISVYPGDLSLPLLGLSESEFDHLSHNIDVIIHNGAEVSFLKSYQALRAPNVSSTKELVKLSLPRSTPIHFISTGGVAQLVTSDVPLDESVPASALSEPGEDTDGYVATKYASERYLENAAGQLGLSVFVHRPTYIVGSGASATDVVGSLLEFSGRARKVPILRGWEGEFDLVGLKQVAGDVVGQCLESVGEGVDRVGMQIRHQCGEKKFRADKLGEYVRLDGVKRSGGASIGEVLEVEWEEWLHVAEEAGLSKAMGRYLGMLAGRRVKLPQIIKGRRA